MRLGSRLGLGSKGIVTSLVAKHYYSRGSNSLIVYYAAKWQLGVHSKLSFFVQAFST